MVTFLDLSKVFDIVNHKILSSKLDAYEVRDDSILEIDAAHYCGEYTSGNWLISNSTTTTNEFHCKMVENQSNRRLYSDGTVSILSNSSMTGDIIGINQGVCVAGESLDGEAIKRRLMENRLPESCV